MNDADAVTRQECKAGRDELAIGMVDHDQRSMQLMEQILQSQADQQDQAKRILKYHEQSAKLHKQGARNLAQATESLNLVAKSQVETAQFYQQEMRANRVFFQGLIAKVVAVMLLAVLGAFGLIQFAKYVWPGAVAVLGAFGLGV
jgi:hypothetical protein